MTTAVVSERLLNEHPDAISSAAIRVLIATEGSGGHLIPALEVSRALAIAGASVTLLYPERPQIATLIQAALHEAQAQGVDIRSIRLAPPRIRATNPLWRLRHTSLIWRIARETITTFRPEVVVGFGGWCSVPVILAARWAKCSILLHEQNVLLGRANRFLRRWADQVALSCEESTAQMNDVPSVVTGLPIRRTIAIADREEAARQFGLDPRALTVLILGGSQGSRSINRLVSEMLGALSPEERATWQFLHLTGAADEAVVNAAYVTAHSRASVAAQTSAMALAYAVADVVVSRGGASTLAELAHCGKPAIVIPYPHAGGHQRANARLVESVGAAVVLEEHLVTPQRLLAVVRHLLGDARLRGVMAAQMRTLAQPAATQRLVDAIIALAHRSAHPNR